MKIKKIMEKKVYALANPMLKEYIQLNKLLPFNDIDKT
jgi:hypothetical protein